MPIRRVPEREMLRLLVACEKLNPDEAARARKLYDDLEAGSIVRLDLESRVWVQRTFRAYELTPKRPPEAGKPSKATSKQLIAAFDAMPRPKKPPGR